jgi:hypothetical protein
MYTIFTIVVPLRIKTRKILRYGFIKKKSVWTLSGIEVHEMELEEKSKG